MTMPSIKKIVTWVLVIFIVYAIVTSPTSAADIARSAWDILASGVQNIFTFFDSLIRGG